MMSLAVIRLMKKLKFEDTARRKEELLYCILEFTTREAILWTDNQYDEVRL